MQTSPDQRPAYTPEIGEEICDRLFEGQAVREICADPAMPDRASLQRWLAEEKEFATYYKFTLQLMEEELLADAWTIADNARSGCLEQVRGGKVVMLAGRVERARARLRVEVRWWVADLLAITASSPHLRHRPEGILFRHKKKRILFRLGKKSILVRHRKTTP
jgi:Bacteriophage Sf6, terminase small subunit-like